MSCKRAVSRILLEKLLVVTVIIFPMRGHVIIFPYVLLAKNLRSFTVESNTKSSCHFYIATLQRVKNFKA